MPDLSSLGLDPYGTVQETGQFTPTVGGIPPGSRLNPFVDPGPWGFVDVGGVRIPGVVTSIDGCGKPEEWEVQKGTKENNASTTWKGTKLAESIKIVTSLMTAQSFDAYYLLRDTLRPKVGERPPALEIVSPIVNFNGISRVSVKDVLPPKHVPGGNYWTGEIELIEFSPPKPADTGKPKGGSGAGGSGNGQPDPNADAKAELDAAVAEAKAL